LESTRPCAEFVGSGTHGSDKGGPILLHPFRASEKVKAHNANRLQVVVHSESSSLDPLWCCGRTREVQNGGFFDVDLAIRSAPIPSQNSLQSRNVRPGQAKGQVIGVCGKNETTPSKGHSLKA